MEYRLVFQFSENKPDAFNFIDKVEEMIESNIRYRSELDGHDIGSGEINFFIKTNQPIEEYTNLLKLFNDKDLRVAYRKIDEDEYIGAFPKGIIFSIK